MDALHDVPGFESATISGDIPLNGAGLTLYTRGDAAIPPVDQRPSAPGHDVAPGFFKTWGIPIITGRDFDEHDVAGHQNVLLISEAGAKKVFPNANPIGKTLLVTSAGTPAVIIGVVGDVRSQRVAEAPRMEFYQPWAQDNFPFVAITVRSRSMSARCPARCNPRSRASTPRSPSRSRRRWTQLSPRRWGRPG